MTPPLAALQAELERRYLEFKQEEARLTGALPSMDPLVAARAFSVLADTSETLERDYQGYLARLREEQAHGTATQ